MDKFLEIIKEYGNGIIIFAFFVILIFLIKNALSLSSQRDRIKEILERRNKIYIKNKGTQELEEEDDENASVTPDTVRNYENKFNELSSSHNALSQLISLFPLMGVLGTVAGLMLANNDDIPDTQRVENMLSSLKTALETTFYGLTFAIILKAIDTLWPSKMINDVEVMLDNFDKKMDLADMEMTKKK